MSWPDLSEPAFQEAVLRVLSRQGRPLSNGAEVLELERRVGDYLGVESWRVIATSSGTAALTLALLGMDRPGETVGVPAMTFVASAIAVEAAGCRVRLVDVDPRTGLVDRWPGDVDVVMPVALDGMLPAATDKPTVVDACPAFGAAALMFPAAWVCFSLNWTKLIGVGEGGLVVTPPVWQLASRARSMRDFGKVGGLPTFSGNNFKLDEVTAALASEHLKTVEQRREDARRTLELGLGLGLDLVMADAPHVPHKIRIRGRGDGPPHLGQLLPYGGRWLPGADEFVSSTRVMGSHHRPPWCDSEWWRAEFQRLRDGES